MRAVPLKAAGIPDSMFAYTWSLLCRDNLLAQRACQLADVSSITPIFPWCELAESERIALRPVIAELARNHLAAERELVRRKQEARARLEGAKHGNA